MYRAEELSGSDGDLKQGTFHGLAHAIRLGCLFRPRKVKRSFLSKADGADVFGALAVGSGWEKRCSKRGIIKEFPLLRKMVAHPLMGVEVPLSSVLVSLNDYFDWSREDIADWLCRWGECKHEIKGGDVGVLRRAPVVREVSIPVFVRNG
jgi:hypothetical protein